MKMKKPPYLSHLLIGEALLEKRPVSTSLGVDQFFVRRVENIISEYRKAGVLFDEQATEESRYSWYKPYRLIETPENIERVKNLVAYFRSKVDSFIEKSEAKNPLK